MRSETCFNIANLIDVEKEEFCLVSLRIFRVQKKCSQFLFASEMMDRTWKYPSILINEMLSHYFLSVNLKIVKVFLAESRSRAIPNSNVKFKCESL